MPPPPPSSPPPPKLAAMQFNFKVTPEIIAPTHYIPCDDGAFGLSFIGELLLVLYNDVRGRKENRRGKGEMRGLSPNPNFVSGTSCMQTMLAKPRTRCSIIATYLLPPSRLRQLTNLAGITYIRMSFVLKMYM